MLTYSKLNVNANVVHVEINMNGTRQNTYVFGKILKYTI